jgi:hypothetical protein
MNNALDALALQFILLELWIVLWAHLQVGRGSPGECDGHGDVEGAD